jgi:hypothetical protein
MKRTLLVIALAGSFALPALAADKMTADPTCKDYMAMDSAGQMKSIDMMHVATAKKPTDDTAATDSMRPDMMAANAMKACSAEPDATLGEAMKMMDSTS